MTSLINTIVLAILIQQVGAPWWLYAILGVGLATDFARAVYAAGEKNGNRSD